jgi:hypothetical protein
MKHRTYLILGWKSEYQSHHLSHQNTFKYPWQVKYTKTQQLHRVAAAIKSCKWYSNSLIIAKFKDTRITAIPSPKYDFKIEDEDRVSTIAQLRLQLLSEFHRKTRNQRKAGKGKVGGYDTGANDRASAWWRNAQTCITTLFSTSIQKYPVTFWSLKKKERKF